MTCTTEIWFEERHLPHVEQRYINGIWCISVHSEDQHTNVYVTRTINDNLTMTRTVLIFTILLACLLCPQINAAPREFYCYKMCRLALNRCMEKNCKGKFPALVPVECLAKHTDCNEKCGFMSKMLKFPLESEKQPVRLRLVEWLTNKWSQPSLWLQCHLQTTDVIISANPSNGLLFVPVHCCAYGV